MADLSQQLQLERDINSALAERNKLLESQRRTLSSQSSLAGDLAASLGSGRVTGNLNNMNSALRSSASALKDTKSTAKDLESALNDAADAAEEASDQTGFFGEALSSLGSVMGGLGSVFSSVASGVISIAASLAKVAFSIFTFPFKLFGSIVQMAQEGSGDMPIAKALEDLRDVLGDLSTGPAKAVRNTFDKISASNRKLGGTALTVRNVFGYGRDGMAALLKDLTELAAATGDRISRLGPILERMGDKAIIFQRGLGLSKEEFADLIDLAEMRGEDPEKAMTRFSKTAVLTAKRFGLSTKDMAKGMKELMTDVENFGHLGPKSFAPITAYARKLGLEIKDMAGIMEKFSGFSDSADAASKLGQVFQMAVDPMKLMAAQNPAEKIDMLRKAFFRAGKSLKDMTYQERKYLAQTTNLTGKSMEAAFALKNQGMGYEKIAAEAAEAEKKQMSQKEVLHELSKGIKRLIQALNMPKVKGFFDSFVQGFERGVMRSEEFRGVLRNIRKGLRQMFRFGMQVGRMFVKFFPGIKTMLDGLSDFLDPSKFKKITQAIGPIFKAFFKGEMTFKNLMDTITGELGDKFGIGGTGVGKIARGFMKFVEATSKVIAGILDYVFKMIEHKVIPFLDSVFKSAKNYVEGGKGRTYIGGIFNAISDMVGETEVGKTLLRLFKPIADVFGENGSFQSMFKKLKPLMGDFVDMMGHDARRLGTIIGCGIWEGITYVWNNTTIWEKLLYGGGLMLLLSPVSMLKAGWTAGSWLVKGLAKGAGKAAQGMSAAGTAAQVTSMGARGAAGAQSANQAAMAAARSSATVQAQVTAARRTASLSGFAKHAKYEKIYNSTLKKAMKKHTKAINKGTSTFLKETSKVASKQAALAASQTAKISANAAVKSTTIAANAGFKVAAKTTALFVGRALPGIFAVATGLYEAFNAKPGRGGQRFVAGVVNSLTLGVWSADEIEDYFFDTKSRISRSSEKMTAWMQGQIKKNAAALEMPIKDYNTRMDAMIAKSEVLQKAIARLQLATDVPKDMETLQYLGVIQSTAGDKVDARKAADTRVAAFKASVEYESNQFNAALKAAREGIDSGAKHDTKEAGIKQLYRFQSIFQTALQAHGYDQKKASTLSSRYINLELDENNKHVLTFSGEVENFFKGRHNIGKTVVRLFEEEEKRHTVDAQTAKIKKFTDNIGRGSDSTLAALDLTVEGLQRSILKLKRAGAPAQDIQPLQARLDQELREKIAGTLAMSLGISATNDGTDALFSFDSLIEILPAGVRAAFINASKVSSFNKTEFLTKIRLSLSDRMSTATEAAADAMSNSENAAAIEAKVKSSAAYQKLKNAKQNLYLSLNTPIQGGPGLTSGEAEQNTALREEGKVKEREMQGLVAAAKVAATSNAVLRAEMAVYASLSSGDLMEMGGSKYKNILQAAQNQVIAGEKKALETGAKEHLAKSTAATKKAVLTEAQNLDKLEQQERAFIRIKQLQDIPKRLAAAKKAFAKLDVGKIEKDSTVMFTKALGVGKAIEAALKESGIEAFAGKKAEDSAAVKGVKALANIIEPSVGALERIAGAARKLKEVIKKNLKFFKNLDLACLACDVYTMSLTAAKLPKTLSAGMMPLLGKQVNIEGAKTETVDTSKDLSEGMTNASKAIAQLEKISGLVSSASSQFTSLAVSITEINKMKVPALSKKRIELLRGMITSAFSMLGAAGSAMNGTGLGGAMAAVLKTTPVYSPKMLGKLTRSTKNMEALGKFFKQAKKTGLDAASASRYATSVKRNAAVMAEAVGVVAEQGKSLNANVTKLAHDTTAEGGGKLTVEHTFGKKVELKVFVTIDTKELGNKLARVDVAGATDNPAGKKFYQIKTGGEPMVTSRA
jgi:hypothetical protein